MSNYGTTGPASGGGVRPRGPATPYPGRGGASGGGAAGGRSAAQPEADDILERRWPNYLKGGYFDAEGCLKIEYVARCLPGEESLPDTQRHGVERLVLAFNQDGLSYTQLRRFFQYCRGLETRLQSGASDWQRLYPAFQLLDARAASALGKPSRNIPEIFYEFIRRSVAAVRSQKDFCQGLMPHFESIVGFAALRFERR